ncbi:MAG TPA: S-methyl-5'-thioadenosine phosphorylase [Chthoniobacteraceae bacterium]|nr:S-methyl-5'-thioadenosine phosphorylase [Chthoniobacteraceae bacterium]
MQHRETSAIGIIGGSGLYEMEGVCDASELSIETPWGPPSDTIVTGTFAGRTVCFLPRHGRGHRLLPHEINHRANLYALRSLGVRWIVSISAVGSLQPEYEPRQIVVPDQFFDRTSQRCGHTFFGEGIAAHVAFADPVSPQLRELAVGAARAAGAVVHDGGTYVNMDGPAFSTRAESDTNRKLGFDVIGMTNLPEAKLAREAEIAFVTLAMVTDYDCWKRDEAAVDAQAIVAHLRHNVALAKKVLACLIPSLPTEADWPEHRALEGAILTDKAHWPPKTVEKLFPFLQKYL